MVPPDPAGPTSTTLIIVAAICLFTAMYGLIEIGRRVGIRHRRKHPDHAGLGLAAIEGAVFGLMGLLIAFTFSGAGSRFDTRRQLIAREANAIGTAYLRLRLLPDRTQPELRLKFRQYLDARLNYYRMLPDSMAAAREQNRAAALQADIWNRAVEAIRAAAGSTNVNAITSLVMQSLNDMIDITTTRFVASQIHPPQIIFGMLLAVVLACSLLAGYGIAANPKRCWIHTMVFASILTVTVLIVLDYEYPRFGLIRIDPLDQVLEEVRNRMQ
jgi:hypothetical protein